MLCTSRCGERSVALVMVLSYGSGTSGQKRAYEFTEMSRAYFAFPAESLLLLLC